MWVCGIRWRPKTFYDHKVHRGLPVISKGYLDRLGERCSNNKFDLNAGKWKSISFRRNMLPIELVYSINETAFERLNEIKDLRVIVDVRMSFLPHIEAIISKSSRMLGFTKRISRKFHDPYAHKALYTSLVRPYLKHAACGYHSFERVQHNFICYAVRRLMPWRVWPLPTYDAR
jgi:hypothetical protein